MKLVFGGAYQGKLEYVKSEFSVEDKEIFRCGENESGSSVEEMISRATEADFKVIYGLEKLSLQCVKEGKEARELLNKVSKKLKNKILICGDISQGLVPVDKEQRAWREMNGRMLIYLSGEADSVIRVFCGLPQFIKSKAVDSSRKQGKSYIHFIRHGLTQGNVMKWYYGITDLPLLDEGRDAIKQLAKDGVYPDAEGGDFYTSGLLRTEETLELIFKNIERTVLEGFREMNFGDFECKSYEELKDNSLYQAWIMDETMDTKAPNGESFNDFRRRVFSTCKELMDRHHMKELSVRHSGRDCHSVVVCHGGVIGTLMLNYFKEENENFFAWIPEPARGYSLIMERGVPVGYRAI